MLSVYQAFSCKLILVIVLYSATHHRAIYDKMARIYMRKLVPFIVYFTLVNVYVDLVVFTRIAGTS